MALARYASDALSLRDRAAYRAAVAAVAQHQGVPLREVAHRRRGRRKEGRAGLHPLALYLAVTAYGIPARAIARAAAVRESYLRKVLAAIEERRDEAAFDRALDELELEVMA